MGEWGTLRYRWAEDRHDGSLRSFVHPKTFGVIGTDKGKSTVLIIEMMNNVRVQQRRMFNMCKIKLLMMIKKLDTRIKIIYLS